MAWKTPWISPETNLGKSTFLTSSPNCSTPCSTAAGLEVLAGEAGVLAARCRAAVSVASRLRGQRAARGSAVRAAMPSGFAR